MTTSNHDRGFSPDQAQEAARYLLRPDANYGEVELDTILDTLQAATRLAESQLADIPRSDTI